jgi:general secretion pathway protein J
MRAMPGHVCGKGRGFTLAEVLLASTITVMIALVAVSALKAVADTSRIIENTTQTTSGIRFAARMLANDLENLYRDADPQNTLFLGVSQGSESGEPPSLRFYTVGRLKARVDQPEGDVYEVEYILGESRATEGKLGADTESMQRTLYRRWWPNPDKQRQPGGILSAIADNIDVFQTRFYDGKQWVTEWTDQMHELPQLLEVTLAVLPEGHGEPTVESFLVSFPRMPKPVQGASGGQGQSGEAQPQQGSPQGSDQQPGPSGPSGPPQNSGGR